MRNPGIISVSNTNGLPGQPFSNNLFKLENSPVSKQYIMATFSTDADFAKTMGIELVKGRYFSRNNPADSSSVLLNESAVRFFGLKDPLGKRIIYLGPNLKNTVIGVVKDFNFSSLHEKIAPLIIYPKRGLTAFLPVRISSKDINGTISLLNKEWKKFVPDKPFEYFFLDEDLAKLYRSELKTGEIISSFSVLAIFIACLGLFGLAAFTAERRTKEIGIRKALGATVPGVIFLLSKEFTKWVLIANIIAWPVAYYFMNDWLKDFAYRINIPMWSFVISGCLALTIAWLTIGANAIKAARANPVESLRYE